MWGIQHAKPGRFSEEFVMHAEIGQFAEMRVGPVRRRGEPIGP